ncbi:MAG: hypothetical protein IKK93_06985 [Campylobacter sp.]|nr:hypothetical protein [Campylobacter sp.]
MAKIDDILNKIQELKNNTFNWNRDLNDVVQRLNDLNFNAEIDHGNYYVTTLEQIWLLDVPKEQIQAGENLHTLTPEEREWYYKYNNFRDIERFTIAVSTHWFINAREQYVRVLINRDKLKNLTNPKEDYGNLYTIYNSNENKNPQEWVEFKLTKLEDQYAELRETLEKLMTIFEYSKKHRTRLHDLDHLVRYDVAQYFGNKDGHMIDDEYKETAAPELIKVQAPHRKVDVSKEYDFVNLIKNPGFDEIKWPTSDDVGIYTFDERHEPIEFSTSTTGRKISRDTNSITFSFTNKRDADNFLFSAIEYINNNNSGVKPNIHDKPIKINMLEKHYLSNKWPMANSQEESVELERTLTHYFVSITKFHDTPIFKEEIWENGIVFEVTNMYTTGYHN